MTLDTVVTGGLVVTMQGEQLGLLDDGALGILDGTIAYVGPSDGIAPDRASRRIDASRCVVLPGLIVGGTPLYRNGSFVDADPSAAVDAARERAAALFERGTARWRDADSRLVDRVDAGWL